ncbi:phosphate-starvation-inducible PsiE family protein [Edaphobacter sp. HDX4]|uniref:phosphate-starvation-inducible PsiE family protein n=1 Tax=Edaphobacter sp. HDX4 TaxID=2794064 RepID=UPI002FE5625D
MTNNNMLTLKSEIKELRVKWQTLSLYERFEQTVVSALTLVIAVIIALAAWQLVLHTLRMVRSHMIDPADSQTFQGLFGMVLTVLIALEFKHTLLVVRHHRRAIVQVRAVVLIALLALVRRFIILDLYQTTPSVVAALAGASLALGVVFWLVGNYAPPEGDALQE